MLTGKLVFVHVSFLLINNNGFIPGIAEQRNITRYLTATGYSLSEIVMFSDEAFQKVYDSIVPQTESKHFFDILNNCHHL